MGKVGNLTRLVDVVEPDQSARGRDGRSLRMVLVGMLALAVALVAVAISGAAPGTDADVKSSTSARTVLLRARRPTVPRSGSTGSSTPTTRTTPRTRSRRSAWILALPKDSPTHGADRGDLVPHAEGRRARVRLPRDLELHPDIGGPLRREPQPAYCVAGPASTFPIPPDPTVVADNNGSGSATSGHQLGGQVFTMYGGTITGVSVQPTTIRADRATRTPTWSSRTRFRIYRERCEGHAPVRRPHRPEPRPARLGCRRGRRVDLRRPVPHPHHRGRRRVRRQPRQPDHVRRDPGAREPPHREGRRRRQRDVQLHVDGRPVARLVPDRDLGRHGQPVVHEHHAAARTR